MPQTAAAKKALRVSARRRSINDRWRRKLRDSLKGVRVALTSGQKDAAQKAYATAQVAIDRAARHRVIARQAAARKKSRLQKAIAKLA